MSRREHPYRKGCAEPGCKEFEYYLFSTVREYDKHATWRYDHPYRCPRHDRPDEIVSPDRPHRQITYTVGVDRTMKVFVGGRSSHHKLGGAFDDFQCFADDFPVGSRVTITVAVEVP